MAFVWQDEIGALVSAAKQAGVRPEPDGLLAFNLESATSADAEAVRLRLEIDLGELAEVQPLFGDDSGDLARFSRLVFTDVDADLAQPIAYDVAYALADAYDLVSSEPDLPSRFFVEPGNNGDSDQDVESGVVKAFCEVTTTPPSDQFWAPRLIRVREAITFSEKEGRPSGGSGVLVAQPDTGVVVPNLDLEDGSLDAHLGWSILDSRRGAIDPLNYKGNPGHGTATSSVVVSRESGEMMGSAPAAMVYPIRCIKAVTIFTAAPVAQAILKAVEVKADVITMSLGGVPSRAVRAAIQHATKSGLIVVAAAGNCVRLVVWPARYPECIAVAGCNIDRRPWKGSCRGGSVDITAPGEQVWHASATASSGFKDGQGTSFAVALIAGAAAQWVGHHGRDTIKRRADELKVTVQDVFRQALQDTADPSPYLDPDDFGPGVVNVERLLRYSLAGIKSIAPPRTDPGSDPGDATPPEYVEILREFGPDAESANIDWRRFGAEVGGVALRRAVSAKANHVELAETAPAEAAEGLRTEAAGSGNQALQALVRA